MPNQHTSNKQLTEIFGFHPATEETGPMHDKVRKDVLNLAKKWNRLLPEGPEKTLAFRYLQSAMMFANATIAINFVPEEEA